MTIKFNRAQSLSWIGTTPRTFDALFEAIPGTVVDSLTAAQLAALIDAMHQFSEKSKLLAEREALSNGGIWDEGKNAFRQLAA
ncbi:hypothetical protein [Agrobacterium pusense]|uniref:hypothetical protein n=1 Tax=Agrobacterium pusense TaxID=648995 RepID=UPI000D346234|nr:hypothetical protein [Agrobacterium pusense]PTV70241.1 hypothetical protein DBL06_25595 [Agrobacterium pusense]